MLKRRRYDDYAPCKRLLTLSERRKKFIDNLYDDITVDKDDKRNSRKLVDDTLKDIVDHIRNYQPYGQIYDHRIVKAGSHPVNAKIGTANEFDTNILLDFKECYWYRCCDSGEGIEYSFVTEENSNMRQRRRLCRDSDVPIPPGCAVVEVQNVENKNRFIHTVNRNVILHKRVLRGHRWFAMPFYDTITSEINRNDDGRIEILPRDIKQDFHAKIRKAISELGMHNVKLDDNAHGPALTITIPADRNTGVYHEISVDMTVSLKCSLMLKEFDWPRPATMNAFDEELIGRAYNAGLHLVPKKDLFWSISFSRAERELLSGIDAHSGCRKRTLKLLKYYLEKCKAESSSELQGISSHILKTQVLWSCEWHAGNPNYWNIAKRDVCLINTMHELENSLRAECLKDYFNGHVNVLQGKDKQVLRELADYLNTVRKMITG